MFLYREDLEIFSIFELFHLPQFPNNPRSLQFKLIKAATNRFSIAMLFQIRIVGRYPN